MKNLLVLLVVTAATVSCNLTPSAQPTPITVVNSNQNISGGSDDVVDVPEPTSNNIVSLDPSGLQLEVDRRAAVSVTVTTPSGVNVPAGDITATIIDPTVVMLSEVIGERVFFRGVNVGQTTIIVHAGGGSAQLSITVVAQP